MEDQRNSEKFIGIVEVHIHEAREIRNICIYQNQDVYAKICLSDDTENKISSQVINKGGRNPIFNETLKLPVQTLDSSLRCEVWMLSRIRNYLEDQLLGFVLIPLSDIVSENKDEKQVGEFEFSSSELFHCPAGFVNLSFKYTGASPEIMEIRVTDTACTNNIASCELKRIEFPDKEIVKENECMVSQYLSSLENDNDNNNNQTVTTDVRPQEDTGADEGDINVAAVVSCSSPSDVGKSEQVSNGKDSGGVEEIIDMYMKGMQEFTDALEKMKLPNKEQEGKSEASKIADPSQRVFYGSRAFF